MISIYDLFLSDDLCVSILKFLSFKDFQMLFFKKISKQMTETLDRLNYKYFFRQVLRYNLKTNLTIFGFKSKQLMSYLTKMNAVIAGGFALSCFTSELYDTSDIDIYIPSKRLNHFRSIIIGSSLEKYLQRNGYEKIKFSNANFQEYYDQIFYEYQNKTTKRKVQLIYHFLENEIANSNVGQSVVNEFDFKAVMCYIAPCKKDSTDSNSKDKKRKNQFNCSHLYDVLNKIIQLNPMCPKLHTNDETLKINRFKRFIKYKYKGYTLSDKMNNFVPMITNDLLEYEKSVQI